VNQERAVFRFVIFFVKAQVGEKWHYFEEDSANLDTIFLEREFLIEVEVEYLLFEVLQ
jgi:hypothetical protein